MMRKILIYVISISFTTIGVVRIWGFLLPLLDSTQPRYFELSLVLRGVLALLLGWGLFKRKEFARILAFWWLMMSLIVILLVFGLILPPDSDFAIHPKLFERPIFDSENNYSLSLLFMFILAAINSLIVIFLGQKETIKMFMSDASQSNASEQVPNHSKESEQH